MKRLMVLTLLAALSLVQGCAALNVAHGVFEGGLIVKRLLLDGNSRQVVKPAKSKTELAQKQD